MSNLTFTNPVITGFNPDPSVVRVQSDFFLVTSTFEYFPGIPIYHSTDLLNWRSIGYVLTRPSQLYMRTVEPSAGIWAPTIRYKDGKFYVTTAAWSRYQPRQDARVFPRGFYVSSDNIWNSTSWSEPVYFDNPGFDQDLFFDTDGRVYLSTTVRMVDRPTDSKLKDFAIHVSEIDLATGRTLTAPVVVRQSPAGISEGSHIIKRNQYYYLFTAEGGTESGHQEWVLRNETGPFGPWELGPRNPLWYNGPGEEVQNTGHADVFDDEQGNWWAVFLGVRPQRCDGKWRESQLGRETFLVGVQWKDDWPIFNGGEKISLLTKGLDGKNQVEEPSWSANLDKSTLELGWYHKHTPLRQEWSLTERHGYLRLYGNCYDLSSPEAPTMLLRKQTRFRQSFKAQLEFRPTRPGYEAGIVLWWSMYSYASVGIAALSRETSDHRRYIVLRVPTKEVGIMHESSFIYNNEGPICFAIDGYEHRYRLTYMTESSSRPVHLQTVDSALLTRSPPVGGAFTGVMFGLYSFGKSEPCLDPADFSNISTNGSVEP